MLWLSNFRWVTFNQCTIPAFLYAIQYELCPIILPLREYAVSYLPFKETWEWGRAVPDLDTRFIFSRPSTYPWDMHYIFTGVWYRQYRYSGGYRPCNPYPYLPISLPVNPWVYPSKRVQEQPNRPRNEWDIPNFDDFHKISYNSLNSGPEIIFLDSFWKWRVGQSWPVPFIADIFTHDLYGLPEPMPFQYGIFI